jgi:hypothetical protein
MGGGSRTHPLNPADGNLSNRQAKRKPYGLIGAEST